MMQSIDTVLYQDESVKVGAFRCAPSHPAFGDSGPIENYVFVFPRRSVRLCHAGGRPFVADPSVVTLYNRGQRYSRGMVSREGDDGDWFAVDHALVLDAVAYHDPAVLRRPEKPFRFPYAPSDARAYLAQRVLFEKLRRRAEIDPLVIEETVVSLLSVVLDRAYVFWDGAPSKLPFTDREQDAADRVKVLLSERLTEALRLTDIAREIGLSPYHLCRAFRAAAGTTLHGYRDEMRLRQALTRLAAAEEITDVALELGYSSHSHFSSAFRRRFRVPPSAARRLLAGLIPLETNIRPE